MLKDKQEYFQRLIKQKKESQANRAKSETLIFQRAERLRNNIERQKKREKHFQQIMKKQQMEAEQLERKYKAVESCFKTVDSEKV